MRLAPTAVLVEVIGRPRPMPSKAVAELLHELAPQESVVAVALGPPADDPALVAARAFGAERAVRIWGDQLADADLVARGKAIAGWATANGIGRLIFPRPARDPRAAALGGVLEGALVPHGVEVEVVRSMLAETPAAPPSFRILDAAAGVDPAATPTGIIFGDGPRLLGEVPRAAPALAVDPDAFVRGVVARLRSLGAGPKVLR